MKIVKCDRCGDLIPLTQVWHAMDKDACNDCYTALMDFWKNLPILPKTVKT